MKYCMMFNGQVSDLCVSSVVVGVALKVWLAGWAISFIRRMSRAAYRGYSPNLAAVIIYAGATSFWPLGFAAAPGRVARWHVERRRKIAAERRHVLESSVEELVREQTKS